MADTSATSNLEWPDNYTPSKFLPADNHLRKQRAWERQPRPAFAQQTRRIWKRYDIPQHAEEEKVGDIPQASPAKAVKKLRVVSEGEAKVNFRPKQGVVAKWDRRKSGLPHKMPFLDNPDDLGPALNSDIPNASDWHLHVAKDDQENGYLFIHESDAIVLAPEPDTALSTQAEELPELVNTAEAVEREESTTLPPSPGFIAESPATSTQEQTSVAEAEDLAGPIADAESVETVKASAATDHISEEASPIETPALASPAKTAEELQPIVEDNAGLFDLSPVKPRAVLGYQSPGKRQTPVRRSPRKPMPTQDTLQLARDRDGNILAADLDVADEQAEVDNDDQGELEEEDSMSTASDDNGYQTVDAGYLLNEPVADENVTTTLINLNDDTDFINDFLNRAKASKAAKIAKRSSLSHKRDSDAVRLALASPQKTVEDADVSSPTPHSQAKPSLGSGDRTIGESEPATSQSDVAPSSEAAATSRRSLRSAIPSRNKAVEAPNSISLRRGDGSDYLMLRKKETQELAQVTRNNTRRNKGGAVPVPAMLKKLANLPVVEMQDKEPGSGGKAVRWNSRLVDYYAKVSEVVTGDEEQDVSASQTAQAKKSRAKRVRALGAVNGTPAKPSRVLAEDSEAVAVTAKPRVSAGPMPRRIPTPAKPGRAAGIVLAREEPATAWSETKANETKASETSAVPPVPRTSRRSIIPRSKAVSAIGR